MKRNLRYGILILLLSAAFTVPAQTPSSNQNYVTESVIKTKGKKNAASLVGLVVDSANKVIRYLDGLGRPLQVITWQGSPSKRDLVTPIAYDAIGREDKKYLPYAAQASLSNGSYKPAAITEQNSFYTSPGGTTWTAPGIIAIPDAAFSKTVFESSPLSHVAEQGASGATWQPVQGSTAGHTNKLVYSTNDISTLYATTGTAVRLYTAVPVTTAGHTYERTLSSTGFYDANQLYLTISKDENWSAADGKLGTTEEYKDKDGKVVLKRTFNQGPSAVEVLSTYYVYDDFGNLSFVLPPGANPDAGGLTQAVQDNFCYQYRYDERQRLIEKKVPGKGWEEMIYNKIDQMVFIQDAVQRLYSPSPTRSFVKYDGLGRVIMTGVEKDHIDSRANVQSTVNDFQVNWETRDNSAASYQGYTVESCPGYLPNMDVEVVNYYDDYDIPGIPDNQSASFSNMTKGLLTATKIKVLGTADQYLWTVNYYNDKGELVKVYQQHYKGSVQSAGNYDMISNTYSFIGQLLNRTRSHYVNGTESLYIYNEYSYDHMGRLVDTRQKTGDNAASGNALVLLSRNTYNELGQLVSKGLHGTGSVPSFAQTVTYRYNERGWLLGQSAPLFAMELKYQLDSAGLVPQYNGNISGQKWGLSTSLNKQYAYRYDNLNRLSTAISQDNNNERIGYDLMGNITRLQRHAAGTLVDQIRYNYISGSRLSSVVDTNVNTNAAFQLPGTTSYAYNSNGNMVERISTASAGNNMYEMSYNHLNLPTAINANGALITYTYDAAGNKLKKQVSGSVIVNNEYISGIHYQNGLLTDVQTELGRVVRVSAINYSYEYVLSDHLGNGRVYFDINAGVARKIQETDYYAFGMSIQRSLSGTENKYEYNGKEKQDQEKMYDYGARFYDPVIGRWNVVDPMASTLYEISPYAYVRNNPALRIDRNGLWDITVHAYKDREKYGYGIAIVTDRNGKEVYRFDVRLEGVGGHNRSKPNSDTPLGVYDIPDENMWISGGDRGGYGANHRLALNGESGEIKESGRGLIRIHGGRQEVYDAKTGLWKPISNAQLKKTRGCLRCADEDVKTLKQITDDLMKKDKKEKGGKLTILDDLIEVTTNNPIPLKGTSTTYVNPGINATTEEKNNWNNIIKQIFGIR